MNDPFADLQAATRQHRAQHGCEAYTFEDGPALTRLVADTRPARVLELGTAIGYTACCLAQGWAGAQIDTVESDSEHVRLARMHIADRGLAARIRVHEGQFDSVLETRTAGYGLGFFDGFAPPLATLQRMHALLAEGGLLVCSNLQLARGPAAHSLAAYLADGARWARQAPIERGCTVVLAKRRA